MNKQTVAKLFLSVSVIFGSAFCVSLSAAPYNALPQIETYATIVYKKYNDAYQEALNLQDAVNKFLSNPTEQSLQVVKSQWLKARTPYSQTEVFRFYEGPIDYVNHETGIEGPEARLNAWPLNEAYIDYVKSNPKTGLVYQFDEPITLESLKKTNQAHDEADVTTGYHAIEFLLWGQDFNANGPGQRSVQDYQGNEQATQRRREYLKQATALLVSDLNDLRQAWQPNKENYAAAFTQQAEQRALADILTGMVTLSGFEMSAERMGTALDSGDQEDEHSCFSDNTHNDFIDNQQGIMNVYFGSYKDYQGKGFDALANAVAPELAKAIENQLHVTYKALASLTPPIDQILASEKNSIERRKMELAIDSLEIQADLLLQLAKALEVDARIVN